MVTIATGSEKQGLGKMSNIDADGIGGLRYKPQRLHPDLEPYLRTGPFGGQCLDHPLVQELDINREFAALPNWAYNDKRGHLDEARKQADWHSYVFLHMRSYRLEALMEILLNISSAKIYWELLSAVWIDSKNVARHADEWFSLWNDRRPYKRFAMDAKERKALRRLDEELTIYRGIEEGGNPEGMSWTLDRKKAIWFARTGSSRSRSILLTARAHKQNAHALLLGRKESEIVIDEFDIIATDHLTVDVGNP